MPQELPIEAEGIEILDLQRPQAIRRPGGRNYLKIGSTRFMRILSAAELATLQHEVNMLATMEHASLASGQDSGDEFCAAVMLKAPSPSEALGGIGVVLDASGTSAVLALQFDDRMPFAVRLTAKSGRDLAHALLRAFPHDMH